MNYRETMEYMEQKNVKGIFMGLDRVRELCRRLGDPQKRLKIVHIAGTNGKGSVLNYISTVLKCAGYRVGRYCSPAVFGYREHFQVNGKWILARELADVMTRVREQADAMESEGIGPSAFEMETAAAFVYFLDQQCDVVVLETGMGGATDASNVIEDPLACVFVSISMDHMGFLGKTLSEIATVKAGIIKTGCPVFSMWQNPEVSGILRKNAINNGCSYTECDKNSLSGVKYGVEKQRFDYRTSDGTLWKKMQISMMGSVQIDNAVLALEVLQYLSENGYPVSEKAMRKGFESAKWKGRMEILSKKPLFIADGGHNEDAAKRLAETMTYHFTNKKIVYIMGMLRDKEYEKVAKITAPLAQHILTVTPPDNPRALSAHELAACIGEFHPSVTETASLEEAVEIAYLLTDSDSVILSFGSLSYLSKLEKLLESRKIDDRSGKNKTRR